MEKEHQPYTNLLLRTLGVDALTKYCNCQKLHQNNLYKLRTTEKQKPCQLVQVHHYHGIA